MYLSILGLILELEVCMLIIMVSHIDSANFDSLKQQEPTTKVHIKELQAYNIKVLFYTLFVHLIPSLQKIRSVHMVLIRNYI